VLQCLGKSLSKSEQISDWERRPLRESQITYAAADCYSTLEVYQYLETKDVEYNLGIQEMVKKYNKSRNTTSKPKSPVEVVASILPFLPQNSETSNRSRVPPSEVKIICDNMIQGILYVECRSINSSISFVSIVVKL
jgi:hypothetical protein